MEHFCMMGNLMKINKQSNFHDISDTFLRNLCVFFYYEEVHKYVMSIADVGNDLLVLR